MLNLGPSGSETLDGKTTTQGHPSDGPNFFKMEWTIRMAVSANCASEHL